MTPRTLLARLGPAIASALIVLSAAACGSGAPDTDTTPTASGTGARGVRATATTPADFNPSISPAGALDTAFGEGGQMVYELDEDSGGHALAEQPDGKLVMAGTFDTDDYAVLRANPNGSLDTGFGDAGLVRTPFGRGMDVANAVALQPDGMIVVADSATIGDDALNENFGLTRYSGK